MMFFFVLGQAVTQKGKKGSRAFVPDLGGTLGAKKQDLTHETKKVIREKVFSIFLSWAAAKFHFF